MTMWLFNLQHADAPIEATPNYVYVEAASLEQAHEEAGAAINLSSDRRKLMLVAILSPAQSEAARSKGVWLRMVQHT